MSIRKPLKYVAALLYFLAGFIGALFVILGVPIMAYWAWDVHNDRKRVVTVNSSTPVFAGSGDGSCGRDTPPSTSLPRGERLKVQRIHFEKDCAEIDIALPDKRPGYVVLGDGDFDLEPALPRY